MDTEDLECQLASIREAISELSKAKASATVLPAAPGWKLIFRENETQEFAEVEVVAWAVTSYPNHDPDVPFSFSCKPVTPYGTDIYKLFDCKLRSPSGIHVNAGEFE